MEAHGGSVSGTWSACELLVACDGTWNACSTVRSFRQCVWAHVKSFLAVLGWVLLEIGYSITLCLCFGSWMNRTMRSESCKDYGHDGGDLLLIVTIG